MKICVKCGYANIDDSNFCENCGEKLSPQNVMPQPESVMPQSQNIAQQPESVMPQSQNIAQQPESVMPQGQNMAQQPQNVMPQYQSVSQGWQPVQADVQMDGLEQKREKKSNVIGIVVAVVVVIVIAILLVAAILASKKFSKDEKSTSEELTVQNTQQEENISEETDQAKEQQKEEQSKPADQEQAESDQGQTESDKSETGDYAEVDINGVDNAYIQAAGTIAIQDGQTVLNIPQAVSVSAYNSEEEIVKKTNVTSMVLVSEDNLEDYIGAEVSIKGKLTVNSSEQMILQVVKMDVEKEAVAEEVYSEGHRYNLILEDVTWQEAYEDCKSRGGYLVQINSEEEFQDIIEMIEDADMQSTHFYLGGRRDADSSEYYWVDEWNEFTGTMLNPEGSSWAAAHWMENEPSFSSEEEQEMYMNLIYYQDNWVLNDVPMDITVYYPGKTGYICEFDE